MSAPGPPLITQAPPLSGSSTLEYSWRPPTSNGGSEITDYIFQLDAGTPVALGPSSFYYKVSSLTNGTTYVGNIAASNANGAGTPSYFRPFQPGASKPAIVSTATASTFGVSSAIVTWTPPSTLPDATIFWYVIQSVSNNASDSTFKVTADGPTQSTFFFDPININSTYYFNITPVNCPGYGPTRATNTIQYTFAFSPTEIPNLYMWFDSADSNTLALTSGSGSNSNVVGWSNKGSYSYMSLNIPGRFTGSIRPTYNVGASNGIFFNNSNSNVTTSNSIGLQNSSTFNFYTSSFVIYTVLSNSRPVGSGTSLNDWIQARTAVSDPQFHLDLGNSVANGGPFVQSTATLVLSNNSWAQQGSTMIVGVVYQPNRIFLRANGSNTIVGSTAGAVWNATTLISTFMLAGYTDNRNFTGRIYDVLFYDNYDPTDQYTSQQIEGYLAWKWGLQSRLPSFHPFKGAAPIASNNTFYPTQVPGAITWFDATDASTVSTSSGSSNLVRWTDKIGYITLVPAAGTPSYQSNAIGTQPAINLSNGHISSSRSAITSTLSGVSTITMFAVARPLSTAAGTFANVAGIYFSNADSYFNVFNQTTSFIQLNSRRVVAGTLAATTAIPFASTTGHILYSATDYNYGSNTMYANSTITGLVAATVTGVTSAEDKCIVMGNDSYGDRYTGHVGEYLIFNTRVSVYNRQRIEGYLAWKWGLTSVLSPIHSFKSNAPVASESTFNPIQVPGMEYWLDASEPRSLVTSGSTITSWSDKSLSKLFSVSANKPLLVTNGLNNRSTISFVGTSNMHLSTFLPQAVGTRDFTMVHLWKYTGPGESAVASIGADATGSNIYLGYNSTTRQYRLFNVSVSISPISSISTNYFALLIGQRTAGINYIYLNGDGGQSPQIDSANLANTRLSIGLGSGPLYLTGEIAESMLYVGPMTPFDRQKIEGYLASKWGLTSNLPIYHPYRTLSPTNVVSTFSPTLITGLQTWIDAADASTIQYSSGSNVVRWFDKSGAGNHFSTTTGTPTRRADAGRSTIYFTTTSLMSSFGRMNYMGTNTTATFMVLRVTNPAANFQPMAINFRRVQYSFGNIQGGPPPGGGDDGGQYGGNSYLVNGSRASTTTSTFSTFHLVSCYHGGTNTANSVMRLNADSAYDGHFCELLTYTTPTAMPSNAYQRVEGYLAWKWGIQTSLPLSHPYRFSTPTFTF